jgi:GNAT superfamily N-acetyltransferase
MTRVRRLEPRDRVVWQDLFSQYNRFYRATVQDDVRDLNFGRLCEGDVLVGIVAVDEADQLMGLMHLVFHPSTWSAKGYCYIEDLFVDRAKRGENVAHALFAEAYRIADERGAERVYWQTQEFNAPARSLYDTIGHRTSFIVYQR